MPPSSKQTDAEASQPPGPIVGDVHRIRYSWRGERIKVHHLKRTKKARRGPLFFKKKTWLHWVNIFFSLFKFLFKLHSIHFYPVLLFFLQSLQTYFLITHLRNSSHICFNLSQQYIFESLFGLFFFNFDFTISTAFKFFFSVKEKGLLSILLIMFFHHLVAVVDWPIVHQTPSRFLFPRFHLYRSVQCDRR